MQATEGHAAVVDRAWAWARWLAWLLGAAALLGLVASFAALVPLHPVVAYSLAFGVVALQTVCVSWAVPMGRRPSLGWVALPVATIYLVYSTGSTGVLAAMVVTAGLLAAGTLVGAAVGAGIEHPGHLLFVVLVSSGMDALSVLHPRGLSAAIVKSEAALSALAMSWPMLGTSAIEPILGVGDVMFSALYIAATRKHQLPIRRTLWALGLGFMATLGLVFLAQIAVPALPLLGTAVLMAHPEARRPAAADRRAGWTGVGLMVTVGLVLFLTR